MKFDAGVPIYQQIMELIRESVVSGAWPPGSRVEPVRELALQFRVNPNTMQRALGELEREELLHSERTSGRFVTDDAARIAALRQQLVADRLQETVSALQRLGLSQEEITVAFSIPPR